MVAMTRSRTPVSWEYGLSSPGRGPRRISFFHDTRLGTGSTGPPQANSALQLSTDRGQALHGVVSLAGPDLMRAGPGLLQQAPQAGPPRLPPPALPEGQSLN